MLIQHLGREKLSRPSWSVIWVNKTENSHSNYVSNACLVGIYKPPLYVSQRAIKIKANIGQN